MAVHRVCKDPWTEPEPGAEAEPVPVPGPGCLCGSCTRFRQGSPVRGAAWPWWPPALCVSAPASAAPESLVGRGR